MFILRSSCVPLFEAVASYCRLPFHSYVREVASDGSLLGGVEIDVLVREDVVRCQTHFSGAVCLTAVPLYMIRLLIRRSGFYRAFMALLLRITIMRAC